MPHSGRLPSKPIHTQPCSCCASVLKRLGMRINKPRKPAVYCSRYLQPRRSDGAKTRLFILDPVLKCAWRHWTNNTLGRRKKKTKSKIINTQAERRKGGGILLEFCKRSIKLELKCVFSKPCKNIWVVGEMRGKKDEAALFLSVRVKMFGWAGSQRGGQPASVPRFSGAKKAGLPSLLKSTEHPW